MVTTVRSIPKRCLRPAALIQWGEHALQPIRSRSLDDVIDVRPVSRVRRGQIVVTTRQCARERIVAIDIMSIIESTFCARPSGVAIAKKLNPECVEPTASTIGDVSGRIRIVQVGKYRVRCITDYQKRNIIAIHDVSAIGAWFKRIGGRGHCFCD